MKYIVFFMILGTINLVSYKGHSTVVYLQSSKAKELKLSKPQTVKRVSAKPTRKCPTHVKRVKDAGKVNVQ